MKENNQKTPSSSALAKRIPRTSLFFLLILLVCALIYLPNLGQSIHCLDLTSYKHILTTTNILETSLYLFTDFDANMVGGYYAPLSSVSLMLDKLLVGSLEPEPEVTFFINWLFHCLNAALLFLLLNQLRLGRFANLVACYLFLVHPVQVPVILWLVERKTVMAGAFYLASYICYLKHWDNRRPLFYVLALIFFILGLLAKPTVVTLPLALLATVFLFSQYSGSESGDSLWSTIRKIAPPVAPFFIISIIWSVLTVTTESATTVDVSIIERPFLASSTILFYLYKFISPIDLVPIHPKWSIDLTDPLWWLPLAGFISIILVFLALWRRIKIHFRWGALNYLIPIIPVCGVVVFGWFQISYVGFHLLYLSMIGLCCCVGVIAQELRKRSDRPIYMGAIGFLICWLGLMPALSYYQAGIWADPIKLWETNLMINPNNYRVHNMLSISYLIKGQRTKGETHLRKALEMKSDYWNGYLNLGTLLMRKGDLNAAVDAFERVIEINPKNYDAHVKLGSLLQRQGKLARAEKLLQKAISLQSYGARPYNELGLLELDRGELEKAEKYFRMAIQLDRGSAKPYNNLGALQMKRGEAEEALKSFEKAAQLQPDNKISHTNAGFVCWRLKDMACAEKHFRKTLELDPSLDIARLQLGMALESQGKLTQAAKQYELYLANEGQDPKALARMGGLLRKMGNNNDAIYYYEQALEKQAQNPHLHNALGELFLDLSQYHKAAQHFKTALQIKPDYPKASQNLKKVEELRD